jgi:hypothetical protein
MTVFSPGIRLEVDGVPAVLPRLRVGLPDGGIGWYQRTSTDCLRAAVATATKGHPRHGRRSRSAQQPRAGLREVQPRQGIQVTCPRSRGQFASG